jgi:LysR family transcriptional regulator, carnitine catabolism transcriptional activator
MDLRQVEQVLAIFDHGSVTAAARALHLAQPSVSETLRRTERELGTELFHRVGRRLRPTPAGEAFVGPARRLLRDRDGLVAGVTAVAGGLTGRLDIACLPTLAAWPLVPVLASLRRELPGVTIRVLEAPDLATTTRLVSSGLAEIALGELPPPDGMEALRITRQELLAVLPPGTSAPGSLTVRDLAAFPLLTGPTGSSTRRLLDVALRRSAARATVVGEIGTRDALVPLVLAGAGATVLPADQAHGAAALGAVVRPIVPSVRRDVGFFYRPGALTPPAQAVLRLAATLPSAPR